MLGGGCLPVMGSTRMSWKYGTMEEACLSRSYYDN